ncbi:MAG: ssk1 response regulator receiver [Chaenotheca gracillima]|nr:MAG: ssk1 response regulator receiver [Chaenotheca gracillima]
MTGTGAGSNASDLKTRFQNARARLLRRTTTASSTTSSTGRDGSGGGGSSDTTNTTTTNHDDDDRHHSDEASRKLPRGRPPRIPSSTAGVATVDADLAEPEEVTRAERSNESETLTHDAAVDRHLNAKEKQDLDLDRRPQPRPRPRPYRSSSTNESTSGTTPRESPSSTSLDREGQRQSLPRVVLELATPSPSPAANAISTSQPHSYSQLPPRRPDQNLGSGRQSLVPRTQTTQPNTTPQKNNHTHHSDDNSKSSSQGDPLRRNMGTRKIWVKRPGASATLVSIREDDLVDDVRDMILKKYANSLGRSFDSPDVTLRIVPREPANRNSREGERCMGPDESIGRALDAYYPSGQTVDDALLIDVPQRLRTPRPSPRPGHHMPYWTEESRPGEGGEYFPPMPAVPSPHLPGGVNSALTMAGDAHHPSMHSISILNTGQAPPLPSPGANRRHHTHNRPRMPRTHTSSPTIISSASGPMSNDALQPPPVPPPLPTPPAAEAPHRTATPPPARVASPRPKQSRKKNSDRPHLPAGLLDGTVPPINVLIVEDNIINLKLLEAFMKRLKVRWQTAMNGREAMTKWRAGGFHLVLMDIQLPVMNGLEATKEIRRLERVNSIGVFSSSAASSSAPDASISQRAEPAPEDKLHQTSLFKSPVIIVALTASSLQSDRHEALAAGCNDFLTKPVNFVWLERKVMEWGCMQALIDFDGWRKWKDFSQRRDENSTASPMNGGAGKAGANASGKKGGANSGSAAQKEKGGSRNSSMGVGSASTPSSSSTGGTTGTGSGVEGMENGDKGAIVAGA